MAPPGSTAASTPVRLRVKHAESCGTSDTPPQIHTTQAARRLKSLANLGETVLVLIGTYDLISMLGPQLTRRREQVHFQRYRRKVARDEFLTVLDNFQWSPPRKRPLPGPKRGAEAR
jgi:hypothetical protein